MLTYFANAACNGKRPSHLSTLRNYPRTTLVTKLMAERDVARFIIAPAGYGKTSVALEYAETVFGFHHVFWLSGKSPCFIRDLDRGLLFGELSRLDRETFLVVFEDVPLLDAARAEKLAEQIDELLAAGNEVIVTCEPTYDAFSQMTDRVLLTARDLLVRDEELAEAGCTSASVAQASGSFARQDRVAALVWGGEGAQARFLRAAVDEELPSDMVLSMFVLLALSSGSIDDAARYAAIDSELLGLLDRSYPHLGIDMLEGTFRTASFGVEAIAGAFLERLPVLAERSPADGADALVCALADDLMGRGACARACELMCELASRPRRAIWLDWHADALVDACFLVEASSVYRNLAGARLAGAQHAVEALRAALLQSDVEACVAARRCADDARIEVRLAASLVLFACSHGPAAAAARAQVEMLADAARVLTGAVASDSEIDSLAGEALDADGETRARSAYLRLADLIAAAGVMLAQGESPSRGAQEWLKGFQCRDGRLSPVAFLCAAWLVRAWSAGVGRDASEGRKSSTGASCATGKQGGYPAAAKKLAARIAAAAAAHLDATGKIGLPAALAIAALDDAWQRGGGLPALDEALVREAAFVSGRLAKQRLSRAGERSAALEARLGASGARAVSRRPPILTVNLFGGMDVSVGETKVSPDAFKRQKVRVLLALLVLSRGRDISRDKLMDMLYPDSEFDAARKNLDSTLSSVRKAIKLPDGSCPYLIRRHKSLSIDASLLASDALELEEVCRMLLFNQPGQGGWSQLVKRVEDVFAGDLLPGDVGDPALDGARIEMRGRLVDALVAASLSLVKSGEPQQGLWFAQAALRRDDSREDVYAALMRAQIAALQRTAALRTYFNCRKMLAEGLGIDPAREIVQLYQSIIETEEELS